MLGALARARDAAFRANVEAIETRLPKDTVAALFEPMGSLCTEAQRDAFVQAFRERAPSYMTGELRYTQAVESMDLCVSARR